MPTQGWSFWIDRGGTFTDIVARTEDGRRLTRKLPSVSPAYEDAAIHGIRDLLGCAPADPFPAHRVREIKLGSTIATNALLERKGARTLLVTTAGHADALLIGDQARPDLFALRIERPAPLYERVIEAIERVRADGRVEAALDEPLLAAELAAARADGIESVAVAFLHADLHPGHECRAGELAAEAGFEWITLSHEASPLPRFLARAETAVADAYLTPAVRRYARGVADRTPGAPLYFMTSAGQLVTAEAFRGRDAVLSGPAGGVVGCAAAAREAKADAVIGFDMGGTSTDVCRFAGRLERREEARIAGVRIRSPMLDVQTVAAGGGSVLTFDGLRARVGPHSAGASPGPAAYGRGGPATVTDANIVLGRLDPSRFAPVFGPDGRGPLDVEAARRRLEELAARMGAESVEAAAEGFIAIAVEQTAQAVRRISTERGADPRGHALVAFGGAAGQVAAWVAEALEMDVVLCPRFGSVLSAYGIGQARLGSLRRAGFTGPLDRDGQIEAARRLASLAEAASADLLRQGGRSDHLTCRAGFRYDGADATLYVPFADVEAMKAAFLAEHMRLFGFVETAGRIRFEGLEVEASAAPIDDEPGPAEPGPGDDQGDVEMVIGGKRVSARRVPVGGSEAAVEGPALLVRADTQIVVPDGWAARLGADGSARLMRLRREVRSPAADSSVADPITLELFNRRFMGVAEAMGAALERTAHSVNIKERLDFSCALFDRDGGLVANAPHMPVHLGSMGASVLAVKARIARFAPGDAFALNNPYFGGTHLPDITVVAPVFAADDDAPAFFVAARGHHADVGGAQPGSMPPFSQRIEDEGVLLDALPILKGGSFLEADVRAALGAGRWPARNPDQNVADLKAQLAACRQGAQATLDLIAAYGRPAVEAYMGHVQANAEAAVRKAIRRLSPGSAAVEMDGGAQIRVAISLDADVGEACMDFAGTSVQDASNFNAPQAICHAAALYVLRSLIDDDIPLNAGCLKPVTIRIPRGCLLNPSPPAAVVAGNVETSQHVVDALYAALGALANAQGTMNNFTFGDAERQYYETICGGAGAGPGFAGADAVQTHMTNSRMTDPEILERRFPVMVERFAILRGSGGAGRWRGGDGAVRRIRFLEALDVALLSSRRAFPPKGLSGGADGKPGAQRLITAPGAVKELPGRFSLVVAAGEAIEIETPGGAGFGAPQGA